MDLPKPGFPDDSGKECLLMPETEVQSLGQENTLEEETAIQLGIVAWRIPWPEEPGGLQSMGWQRVGHD